MNNDPTSSSDSIEKELKRFQGTWKQIAYERDGVTEPLDEHGWNPITTFTAEEFVVTLADGSIPIKGTYRIDPTRNPKTVDWTRHDRRGRREDPSGDLRLAGGPVDLLRRVPRIGEADGV